MRAFSSKFPLPLIVCLVLAVSGCAALSEPKGLEILRHPDWVRTEVADGVVYYQRHQGELFGTPQVAHLLLVNLDEPGVEIRFAAARHAGSRTAPVEEIARHAGAVAAVNGGFGHGGRDSTNSGIFKIDGEILPFLRKEPDELRFVGGAAMGIDDEGNWHFMNRPGDEWPEDWPEMRHALAGGHRLIEAGKIHPSLFTHVSTRDRRHAGGRHPRTAVGLLPGRVGVFIAVDGRHPGRAEGLTLMQLAEFLHELGCVEALNLDGGGSTTMWLRDKGVVNHPSDNQAFDLDGSRRVRSSVVVLSK